MSEELGAHRWERGRLLQLVRTLDLLIEVGLHSEAADVLEAVWRYGRVVAAERPQPARRRGRPRALDKLRAQWQREQDG